MSSELGPDLNLEDSGISEEDRREIAERIEAISLESRIEITPETFTFRGTRRSGMLPFLANVVALVLIAVGILGAYLFFQQRQSEISTASGTFTTAEGRLIAELRRQTTLELSEKDRAMGEVRRQLTEVQVERDEILAEIDARVREREAELRLALLDDMELERERLVEAGASASSIRVRLAEFESTESAAIQSVLQSYRRELEDEYATNLARLQALQRQYEQELRALQEERLAISRGSDQREQELREQLVAVEAAAAGEDAAVAEAAREAGLEAEAMQASSALVDARTELALVSELAERRSLVEAQVSGLYRQIADRVLLGEYGSALATLGSLRTLLDDPDFRTLPGIEERLTVDLVVAETLETLIRAQMATLPARSESEELLATLRSAVQRAETLARQGDDQGARIAHDDALRVLPAVATSYAYMLAAERTATDDRLLDLDVARAAAATRAADLESALAIAQDRVSGLEARVAELETAGADDARVDELAAALARAEESIRDLSLERDTTAAERDRAREEIDEITAELAEVTAELARVGLAASAPTVDRDAELAGDATTARLESEIRVLEAEIDELESGIESREAEVATLTAAVERARGRTETQAATIDRLRVTLENERSERAKQNDELSAEIETLSQREADLTRQLRPLSRLAGRYEAMIERYDEYTSLEDAAFARSGAGSVAEAKLELDAFLTSAEMLEAFPELFDRFSRYQRAFEAEGREAAILELIDVVFNLSAYDTGPERAAFLQRETERTDEGSFLRDFLAELSFLVE